MVAPADAVPDAKDQINFTDPESRIMKASNKGWDQCGNAQARRRISPASSKNAPNRATRICHHGVPRRLVRGAVMDPAGGRCTSVGMTKGSGTRQLHT